MSTVAMKKNVRVLYLGGSRAQAGCREEELEVPEGTSIRELAAILAERHPRLAPLLGSVRWARNHDFADLDDPVAPGDEIAVLPPVAGGAPGAEVIEAPIDVQATLDAVRGDDTGAAVLFVGTVRDRSSAGKEVVELAYEAYEPMATRQLEAIVHRLEAEHPGLRMKIVHRRGSLPVGTISVVVAAASPHREAAFDACREAIEAIKRDVPIWKNEKGPDGESWVGWGGG